MIENVKRLEWNIEISIECLRKLSNAINIGSEGEVYKALGEALLWICTTDDWLLQHRKNYLDLRKKHPQGRLLFGVRYAFNAFKHNMDILSLHQVQGGFQFPIQFPLEVKAMTFHWATANEKFTGRENQKQNYRKFLEGKEIYPLLKEVVDFLASELYKIRGGLD